MWSKISKDILEKISKTIIITKAKIDNITVIMNTADYESKSFEHHNAGSRKILGK